MSLPICGKFCCALTLKDCRCRYVVIGGRQPSTALVQPILETVRRWVPTCFAKSMTCPGIGYPEEWKEDQPGIWHLDSTPGTTEKLIQTWPWAGYSAALVPRFCKCEMRERIAWFLRSLCSHHSVIIPSSLAEAHPPYSFMSFSKIIQLICWVQIFTFFKLKHSWFTMY